jgi:hypothetical protein
MTPLTVRDKVVAALQAAGATEEMVAGVVGVFGEFGDSPPRRGGRPRKYADANARKLAWKRAATKLATKPGASDVTGDETPDGRNLRVRLIDASNGNFDALSDISPIRALLEQGCDLEADILPIVAREVPELPRPLKNWGAPWLVRDILAARDLRVAAETQRRLSAHGGYRAGSLIKSSGGEAMDQALRDRLSTLQRADDGMDVDDALPRAPPLSLPERLALGSADDVEAALRRIHDWRPLPAELAQALISAADLCAAVREFLRDSRAGERKGLGARPAGRARHAAKRNASSRSPRLTRISGRSCPWSRRANARRRGGRGPAS